MNEFNMEFLIVLGFLLLAIVIAIIRVLKGPTAPDRVVGLDTINTIIISAMVIFGAVTSNVIYIDVEAGMSNGVSHTGHRR